ncbi:MAG: tRNA (adenosine(37)-N6)-threonylcarbamoyltransferase complex dimerization subunit type 1 TsaB [Chloroflexota bacterium]
MSPILLAIDTATGWSGIALYDGNLLGELNWRAGRQHTEQLLPMIERMLDLAGIERESLQAVGVARGPGSYTGVRVGITVARVLAFALGIPSVGVDALDVTAYAHRDHGLPVRAFLDAGRRRYATALYLPTRAGLERTGTLQSVSEDQMDGLITSATVCCGELSDAALEALAASAGEAAVFPTPATTVRRSAVLAEIAWRQWQTGGSEEFDTTPIYITQNQA